MKYFNEEGISNMTDVLQVKEKELEDFRWKDHEGKSQKIPKGERNLIVLLNQFRNYESHMQRSSLAWTNLTPDTYDEYRLIRYDPSQDIQVYNDILGSCFEDGVDYGRKKLPPNHLLQNQ